MPKIQRKTTTSTSCSPTSSWFPCFVYGVLRTEFLGNQLRMARVPLTILLSVPGILLLVYIVLEAVYTNVGAEYESDGEEEGEEEGER